MAAALTDYTTFTEVRAALGVEADELEDSVLELDLYVFGLLTDLEGVADGVPAAFASTVAVDEGARTDVQARFYRAVKMFSAYSVARQLCTGLALFAPKSVTDGKAGVTRDSNSPHKATIERVQKEFERLQALLETRYSLLIGGAAVSVPLPTFFIGAVPTSDPVLGT